MNKKIFTIFSILLTIFSISCAEKNENQIINLVREELSSDYNIVDYSFGHFLSKKELSLVVFCDKIRDVRERQKIYKIFIYQINNNTYDFYGELNTSCCYFGEGVTSYYKQVGITQNISDLGESHHFGWVGDFNENGITEFIFFQSAKSAEGATIEFWEYIDSEFICTLKAKDDIAFIVNTDKKNKTMFLERYAFSNVKEDYEKIESKIVWDSNYKKYIETIIE